MVNIGELILARISGAFCGTSQLSELLVMTKTIRFKEI